ncbi:DUF3352 domain-containing protein [Ornithinimicrobium sp. Y1694]|uniref:DUF3352 domain-containing protein n=1 Tax=Ornithinimicrobium sp. Y1694 TaxID=3418590 RepID=UPI003CF0DA4F
MSDKTSTVTEQPGGDITESGGSNKGWLMAGIGVGAAALIGGGTYLGIQFLGGGGDQPDSVLPATSAAYVRVDLDPSAGQKVAAVRFFQGMDEDAKARLDQGEWREYVFEKLQEDGTIPADLSYEEDVKPWLGDRAGLAAIPNGEDEPIIAIAVQVKDGQKALDAVDQIIAAGDAESQDIGYYLDDDYIVFTQEAHVDTVKAAAEQGTLSDHDAYTSDMDDLGDAGIASYWMDSERIAEMSNSLTEAQDEFGAPSAMDMMSGPFGSSPMESMSGRSAGALRLNSDSIEIHGIGRGVENFTLPELADTAQLVLDLPADTVGAFAVENGSAWVDMIWDAYGQQDAEGRQQVVNEAAAEGVTLPDDIKAMVGDSLSLSVGPGLVEAINTMSQTETGMPALPIAYRVDSDSTRINTLLNDSLGLPPTALAQRTDEGILTLGMHQPYVDSLNAPADRLGDDATFKAAVPNASDAHWLFYVNVNDFEQYYLNEVQDQSTREALEALGAVGWSATVDNDTDSHFTLRFVADQ